VRDFFVRCFTDEDICGDDVLLMMQFPASEIGRKVALTVSHPMMPGKFRAREFPVGTGLFSFAFS